MLKTLVVANKAQFFERRCTAISIINLVECKKGRVFPYSLPSVGPRADPCVRAVSPQVTLSHQPDGRLPLLRPGLQLPL